MWLLTTRNRPEMCREVLAACVKTKVSTPGCVWMDGCDYGPLDMPDNWDAGAWNVHLNIGEIMRRFFSLYPGMAWYGWMADDCVPLSERWDRRLIEAAGADCVAYPDDGWQQGVKERDGTPHVTSIVCFGGDFVRKCGFWALPGQTQMFIDDVWESVAVPTGRMRYRPDVKSEHRHFANGKRRMDATDASRFNGADFPQKDRAIYERWLSSRDRVDALKRFEGAPQ
jgi:hypothetical protein